MIVLTVKLVQHGQIKIGHVLVISSALVSTILGLSTTMATVK